MNNKKAVLFDMDGTLIDTFSEMKKEQDANPTALFTRYFNYRMKRLPSYSYTEMIKLIEHDFLMKPFQKIIKRKLNDQMLRRYHNAQLKTGAMAFLQYLKEQGYILCLCTNNARHIVEYVLQDKGLQGMFSQVITSQDVERPKPDPQMYLCAKEHCKQDAQACVIFEDMLEGIEAANAAGIECVAVYDAFNEKDKQSIETQSVMVIHDYRDERLYEIF